VVEEANKKWDGGGMKYSAPNINVLIFFTAYSLKSEGALAPYSASFVKCCCVMRKTL